MGCSIKRFCSDSTTIEFTDAKYTLQLFLFFRFQRFQRRFPRYPIDIVTLVLPILKTNNRSREPESLSWSYRKRALHFVMSTTTTTSARTAAP